MCGISTKLRKRVLFLLYAMDGNIPLWSFIPDELDDLSWHREANRLACVGMTQANTYTLNGGYVYSPSFPRDVGFKSQMISFPLFDWEEE